jgi:hypothetical protein
MRNRRSIDALAGTICLASLVVATLAVWNRPPKTDSAVYSQVGKTLAQQALAVLPPGGRIVIIARDLQVYRQPAMEIALKEFRNAVGRTAEIDTHSVQVDPLRPVEVPPGDFYEAIRRAKTNDVIVSFLGPPILEPEQQEKLTGNKRKIVALCTGNMAEQADLSDLARRGLLHAAIVNRRLDGDTNKSATPFSFDQLYQVIREGEFGKMMTAATPSPQ